MDAHMETDVMECPDRKEHYVVPILYMAVATVGIIGNFIVCCLILFFKKYKKTIINIYIMQLAIADFIFSFQIYFQAGSMLQGRWTYGKGWCKVSEAIKMLSYYTSVIFLTVMSIDRYIVINLAMSQRVRKCRTKIAACIVSVCAWCIPLPSVINIFIYADVHGCACVLDFPDDSRKTQQAELDIYAPDSYTEYYYNESDYGSSQFTLDQAIAQVSNETQDLVCSLSGSHISQHYKTWIVCNFLLAFVIPLVIICVSYALILKRVMNPTLATEGCESRTIRYTRRRVTRIVVGLVTLFVICWLPYHSFQLARLNDLKLNAGACSTVKIITVLFAYCNSAVNPFFCICVSENFCKSMVNAIGSVRIKSQQLKSAGTSNRDTRISSLAAKSCDDVHVLNKSGIEDDYL